MEELLQKLLEAEILGEDTKSELEEAFNQHLNEAVEAAKAEASADVRAELTEQWVNERDALIEAVDNKVGDFLDAELNELKEDIERYRDLEAEYAEKLVEAKASMADELKGDLAQLIEQLDAFLEIRLTAELDELMEDIEEVKKNDFGRRIYEAMEQEFRANFADEESAEADLRETQARLNDTSEQLEEALARVNELERNKKLDEVLAPLTGKQREIMEAILKNVDTKDLEQGYKTFIGRVLRESDEAESEKEDSVLAEGASEDGKEKEDISETAVLATGDDEELLKENEQAGAESRKQLSDETRERLRRWAGISN
jgi:hypothetical protein